MTAPTPLPASAALEEAWRLSLEELSRSVDCSTEWLIELVHEGVLEPQGDTPGCWRFDGASLRRVRVAWRLSRDLELNLAGVALALDLLDEIRALRQAATASDAKRSW